MGCFPCFPETAGRSGKNQQIDAAGFSQTRRRGNSPRTLRRAARALRSQYLKPLEQANENLAPLASGRDARNRRGMWAETQSATAPKPLDVLVAHIRPFGFIWGAAVKLAALIRCPRSVDRDRRISSPLRLISPKRTNHDEPCDGCQAFCGTAGGRSVGYRCRPAVE